MTSPPTLDLTSTIAAPAARVFKAFFDPDALRAWWQVTRSVTTPRVLGPYAVEWTTTEFRDDILGPLGGVFRGTIVQFQEGQGFFVADAFWLPPDGEPIGPMALEVQVHAESSSVTRVRVTQNGFEESARWRRYYEVVAIGWSRALASMKALLER
jgi:uncharacterized protein YndB with AHSA1/START domain